MSTPVGYVVGEVKTDEFTFVTNPELSPPRLEYIVVRGVRERVGDELREADVLAQVAGLSVNSRLLLPSMNYSEVESILRRLGGSPPVVVGQAKVLGYFDGRSVRLPRGAAMPGAVVERAPDDLLQRFFSQDVSSGLHMGTLINRPEVEVLLDPNGLRRHLAVIAQTGAGKSYTVGVLLEQLLGLGGTVVVFDPNSDYVLMGQTPRRQPTPHADRVQVYRVPSEQQNRITNEQIGHVRRLTVQFSQLEVDEIYGVAGIAETSSNIRQAIKRACENLAGRDYTPKHLLDELERIAGLGGFVADGGDGGRGGAGRGAPPGRGAGGGRGGRGAYDPVDGLLANNGVDKGPAGLAEGAGDDPFAGASLDDDATPLDPDRIDDWLDAPRPAFESQDTSAGDGGSERGRRGSGDAGNDLGRGALKPPTPDEIAGAARALKHIEFLAALKIWGFEDVPMDDLLRPMSLATVDLAGLDRKVADFVVTKLISDVWKQATRYGLTRPVFLVLEEAHNFVPSGPDPGKASGWIKRIAAEGRKFGIFLVLVTQRPYKVHQDTLSQCGSQIIMRLTNPEDQNAVRRASEGISESLLGDLPGLNVGEAVVLGPLVRVPVMVRVAQRQSAEGGSDIDVVERLEAARAEATTGAFVAARRAAELARGRTAWVEEV